MRRGEAVVDSIGAADGGGGPLGAGLPIHSRAYRSEQLPRRIAWADLLKRVFEVDALRCPDCGGRMRLIAAITDPSVARQILECLALPPRAPPLALANEVDLGPVVGDHVFEPTGAEADEDPGFDFDPSPDESLSPNDDS